MRINDLMVATVVLVIAACTQSNDEQTRTQDRKFVRANVSYLNEDYARFRSRQVEDVSYKLTFNLSATADEFQGRAEVNFDLLIADEDLTIDFSEGTVEQVLLNGKAIKFEYNNWFISIDRELLQQGSQQLSIAFSHPYSSNGSGLYRFKDPEDGRVYVYSDFEPYDANRMFPAFDQPDLKAAYTVQVVAPADWLVVTARRETEVIEQGETRLWRFPQSERFSTYVFSLHAGPYRVWEEDAEGIPLRLLARQSLAEYVDAEEWFTISQQGFAFFQDYFDIAYPFHKYDQLIVPDFNSGAMENVAAVTFSERYIQRGSYTMEERERIANVILHEMAHMWFGNLVTMDWWNGLWLNESFATYMAYLALTENTVFSEAWHSFYSRSKLWAYDTDEQVTRHPIELPVDNTESGFANFDGITYGKGASVLKQLSFLIDSGKFRAGVSDYLKSRVYANSQLNDFIGALAGAADRELDEWTRQWLYNEGTNIIRADYQCQQNRISAFHIIQRSAEATTELREHRLQLGLYKTTEGQYMQLTSTPVVTIKGADTELAELVGGDCPDFVYPNYGDQAFARVELPEKELTQLKRNINGFDDALLRSMLWRNLWEAVRDARLPLTDYADIVLTNIGAEHKQKVLAQVSGTLEDTLDYLYLFQAETVPLRDAYLARMEDLAWNKLQEYDDEADLQKLWFDHFLYIAHSSDALAKMKALLNGETSIAGLKLDQDRRWALAIRLSAEAYTGIEAVLEKELQQDPSSNGEKAYIAAQAAAPDLEGKKQWLQKIRSEDSTLALAELRAAMYYLYPPHQAAFRKMLLAPVLQDFAEMDSKREQQYLKFYARYLLKGYCSTQSNLALQAALEASQNSSLGTRKALKIALQEDQRCMDIKALLTR